MRTIEELIREAERSGFNIEARVAKINEGFSYHERAIFSIQNGVLKIYTIEALTKGQKEWIAKCRTTEELEKMMRNLGIRTGQPLYLMDSVYVDDYYLFNIENGSVELYMISSNKKI